MSRRRVALFRGINVGKAKRISMEDLRGIAAGLGYLEPRTLLNSGNLVFTLPPKSKGDPGALIEQALVKKLGVTSRVTLLTGDDVAEIVAQDPFAKVADNHSRYMITVITDPKDRARLAPIVKQDWGRERVALGARVAYAWCPDSILESPLSKALGKALGSGATTRNFATMSKLHALCGKPD
jgi:uncharacterized protein (DUF1697 family)